MNNALTEYDASVARIDAARRARAAAKIRAIPDDQPTMEDVTSADMEGFEPRGSQQREKVEPEPLRAQLPVAETYPVEALGEILGGAAMALHESVKAPLAMCCQSVLAAASLTVQSHYDIKLPWGERKPLSLFLLTVGESGERKSGIDDLVLGAAKVQERADMEAYQADFERYQADLASWTHSTEAARKVATAGKKSTVTSEVRAAVEQCGEKPAAPIVPLRFVSDPTVEGLFKLLAVGQPSVALFSDEGGLLIGGHALNSDNALKTMARWCKLWDGSPFDRVRAGDGSAVLYGRRMALHQLAQPDVMTKLLSDRTANGQGLLARCLVAWPESTIGTRFTDHFEWAGEQPRVKRLYAALKSLMEAQPRTGKSEQELDPLELPLSESAKAMAVAASNQFEKLMAKGADLAEMRDRAAKGLENACRIAGVLAVIEGGLSTRQIEESHLERALILVQWYLAEALRIRGAAAVPQVVTDAETLSAWLSERSMREFRTDPVLRKGPNQLRNKPRLMAAIAELLKCGYLTENEPGKTIDGVRARKSWEVIHVV
jgi:putative DNA primase/helicase